MSPEPLRGGPGGGRGSDSGSVSPLRRLRVLARQLLLRLHPTGVAAPAVPPAAPPGGEAEGIGEEAAAWARFCEEGEQAARKLGNRGPMRFGADGRLAPEILEAWWRCGFYVFEGVVRGGELRELQEEFEALLEEAPAEKGSPIDRHGRPLRHPAEFYSFVAPLSDPLGGSTSPNSRHPVKMQEFAPPAGAPRQVVSHVWRCLEVMESFLRLYGHPGLLKVAESINGPDFTPLGETIYHKPAGLGHSVAWHQDGITHWASPDWDPGTHGFNFTASLYDCTARNGLWIFPGSHREGKIDIKARVALNGGSVLLPGAVPVLCRPGDVFALNRQTLHCSFANTSPEKRVTLVFGFNRRKSVLDVPSKFTLPATRHGGAGKSGSASEGVTGAAKAEAEKPAPPGPRIYDAAYIHARSRCIQVAIDARRQRYPDETPYTYQPLRGEEEENRYRAQTKETVLKDYWQRDIGI